MLVEAGREGSVFHRLSFEVLIAKLLPVLIIAPGQQQSGEDSTVIWTESTSLTIPSQYDHLPVSAPVIGRDPSNERFWYYNGTRAACAFVALDYVLPRYYPDWHQKADLFVAGPNYGQISVPS